MVKAPRWPARVAFASYGLTLGLRANRRALQRTLEAMLPPGARPVAPERVRQWYSLLAPSRDDGDGAHFFVEHDRQAFDCGTTRAEALVMFEGRMRMHLAVHARRRVFVHAGAVGWRGRAIVLPGTSFAGKSTLVAALVAAGATYLSDEYAVLDERGRVHPFAQPISLRPPGSRRGLPHDAAQLGAIGRRPLPVGLVVSTRFREGAIFRPAALSPGEAMLDLLQGTFAARYAPERVWPVLRAAVESAVAVRSERGEAKAAAAQILDLIA